MLFFALIETIELMQVINFFAIMKGQLNRQMCMNNPTLLDVRIEQKTLKVEEIILHDTIISRFD